MKAAVGNSTTPAQKSSAGGSSVARPRAPAPRVSAAPIVAQVAASTTPAPSKSSLARTSPAT